MHAVFPISGSIQGPTDGPCTPVWEPQFRPTVFKCHPAGTSLQREWCKLFKRISFIRVTNKTRVFDQLRRRSGEELFLGDSSSTPHWPYQNTTQKWSQSSALHKTGITFPRHLPSQSQLSHTKHRFSPGPVSETLFTPALILTKTTQSAGKAAEREKNKQTNKQNTAEAESIGPLGAFSPKWTRRLHDTRPQITS